MTNITSYGVLFSVLTALVGEMAKRCIFRAGPSICQFVSKWLNEMACERSADDLKAFINKFGELSPKEVRSLIDNALKAGQVTLRTSERRELETVLINLAHGSRRLSSDGRPRSSYLRCEHLVQQLLDNLQPVLTRGRPVGEGFREWILDRFLGMGSFGEVWVAYDSSDPNRDRALQNCRAFKFFTSKEARQWIQAEADNLREIQLKLKNGHPNLVRFEHLSLEGQKHPFLKFEYVGGGSLEDWVVEDQDQRVPLDVWEVMRGVVEGLSAAHKMGLFHRDLKPANILLTNETPPQVKITDFGLAKLRPNSATGSALVSKAAEVGTRMYLPPEVHRPFTEVDPAKQDIFSLGVIWYQLCMSQLERPPYNFTRRLADQGVDSCTIDRISRCLAHPDDRYADAMVLKNDMVNMVAATWPVPKGRFDVQHLFREYLAATDDH